MPPPRGLLKDYQVLGHPSPTPAMDKVAPVLGGLASIALAYKVVPVMYHWELIPGVASPAWWERSKTLRYDHYSEGIVYSQYDNGDPIRELPEESKGTRWLWELGATGKMLLKQKRGGWKLQSEMEQE
eukprot:Skav200953  [mRNA]  locus=scaffold448:210994:213738:- [translate_table: standard]